MANTGNIQQIIDYGVVANDGLGDPLRTAFIKTDENFDNIWLAGPVGSNITVANNTIQTNNTNGNLVLKPNGVGVIKVNSSIIPDIDQVRDLGSANNRFGTIYASDGTNFSGNISVNSITINDQATIGGDVTIAGNLTVTGESIANLSITDKVLVIANGSPNAASSNGAGIVIAGANAVIEYNSNLNSISSNKKIVAPSIDVGSITNQYLLEIRTANNGSWQFAGNIFRAPEGGSWQSTADTIYLTSPTDGYINLQSTLNGNAVSELFMEHSFIRFMVDNGGPPSFWKMNLDGSFDLPNYTLPASDGNSGETLKTNGNGVLYWSSVSNYGNANVAAYLPIYTGNISANNINSTQNLYTKTGTFTGDSRGENSIYAGFATFTFLGSDVVAQFAGNVDQYTQLNFQNYNSGAMASGDYVITSDNGTDTTHFLNLGLTSSNWDGSQPNSLGTNIGANDGYLYVQDGNMSVGTKDGDTVHVWTFDTTGGLSGQGKLQAGMTVTSPVAIANLSPVAGARAFVNDSNLAATSSTFGLQVGGGGSNVAPVWSDGTNWYIG